jgi:hypothetical protein
MTLLLSLAALAFAEPSADVASTCAVAAPSHVLPADGAILTVAPQALLAPDTDYVVSFESWDLQGISSEFRTWSLVAEPPAPVRPRAAEADAWWHDGRLFVKQVRPLLR